MLYGLTADLVVLLHFGFILFVLFGGGLVLVWRRIAWVHVPAVIWGCLIEFAGWYCPLTPLEQWLRKAAGEVVYLGGFVEHHIAALIYPAWLTRELQILLGSVVLIANISVYLLVWRKRDRSRP